MQQSHYFFIYFFGIVVNTELKTQKGYTGSFRLCLTDVSRKLDGNGIEITKKKSKTMVQVSWELLQWSVENFGNIQGHIGYC